MNVYSLDDWIMGILALGAVGAWIYFIFRQVKRKEPHDDTQ